jgi:cytochrome c553
MHPRKLAFWLVTAGLAVLITMGIFFLLPAQSASAQCGSQASSCKNCHETQGQDPVSNDLTTWHGQHAFGDFCYLCHGGNNQATDKTAAHVGMIDPLSDIVASCKSCHPKDYEARAQLYANTLGIKVNSLKSTLAATANPLASATPAPVATATTAPLAFAAPAGAAVVPAANIVDYSQRYNEVALGMKPANTGNVILVVLIAALVLGGGFFVARREGWIKISFQDTSTIQGSYPADVVDMVPELAKLRPSARQDLHQLLSRPGTAAELFALASKLIKGAEPSTPSEVEPAPSPEKDNPNQ